MTLTADDSREMSYLQTAGKADGIEQPSEAYVALCVQHFPKVEGVEGDPYFLQMDSDSQKVCLFPPATRLQRLKIKVLCEGVHLPHLRRTERIIFARSAVSASPLHKYLENIHEEKENEQMNSTIYKRRSINLDDRTYKRGKLLAKSQTVSLSALLRLLINGAYEQCPDILQQQDGSPSC
jgi:hypothetical protein